MIATSREYMALQIKRLREARGVSAQDLADRLGNSVKTVHAWERGQGQPDADKLVQICRALDAEISDFYDPALVGSRASASTDPRTSELAQLFNAMGPEQRDALMLVARALCGSQGARIEH